jgi:hypothetical protein
VEGNVRAGMGSGEIGAALVNPLVNGGLVRIFKTGSVTVHKVRKRVSRDIIRDIIDDFHDWKMSLVSCDMGKLRTDPPKRQEIFRKF